MKSEWTRMKSSVCHLRWNQIRLDLLPKGRFHREAISSTASGFLPPSADLVKKDCNFVSKLQSFFWYGWQDLNLHAIALEPKSSVSANFTTSAKHHYYSTKIDYVKSLLPQGKDFLFFYLKIVAFCRLIWYSNCCLREWLSGRVSPCQGESRGSESRLPLHA